VKLGSLFRYERFGVYTGEEGVQPEDDNEHYQAFKAILVDNSSFAVYLLRVVRKIGD